MSHVRKQIRDAARTLFTGLPSFGERVETNRATAVEKSAALSLAVRTPSEQSVDLSRYQQIRTMVLRLDISGKARSEDALTDAMDAAALELERALALSGNLGGLAQAYEYRGADLALSGEGEAISGVLSLAFDLTVFTDRDDPDKAL